jgi:hypothetical protein
MTVGANPQWRGRRVQQRASQLRQNPNQWMRRVPMCTRKTIRVSQENGDNVKVPGSRCAAEGIKDHGQQEWLVQGHEALERKEGVPHRAPACCIV